MNNIRISKLTKEYVRVPVAAKENGVVVDPTNPVLTVEMAFTTGADPSVWSAAGWETDGTTYFARILVGGPSTGAAVELAAGTYVAWVRITDTPERPVVRADNLVEVY